MSIQKLIPWKGIILSSILLANSLLSFAQERKINGRVTDPQGDPIPGVSVVQQGTTSGSTTNEAGEYNISLKPASDVLVFSAIGFRKLEAKIGNRTEINIKLEIDQKSLDEVVVLGYGSKQKSLVTGSISSISAKDFEKQAITTVDQALQGRTTGVQMFASSGAPGSSSVIRIRGAGSNGKTDPLYLVDGMKTSSIDNISPADIANIEVLKDAASTAIYGTDGGNGIIVITTKGGKFNAKPSLSYSIQTGTQSLRTNMELMNASQFKSYQDLAGRVDPTDPTKVTGNVKVVPNGVNTNWLNETFQSAPMTTHNLSFSGGGPLTSYLISGSYTNQDGIIGGEKANFKRYTARFNTKNKITEWLEVGNNLTYTNINKSSITEDDEYRGYVNNTLLIDPLTPAKYTKTNVPAFVANKYNGKKIPTDQNGNIFGLTNFEGYDTGEIANPLALIDLTKGGSVEDRILGNVFVNIKPIKGLTLTSRFGVNYESRLNHTWNPTFYVSSTRSNTVSSVNDQYETTKSWLFENFATYTTKFAKHDITGVLGYTAEKYDKDSLGLSSAGLSIENENYAYHNYTTRSADRVSSDKLQNSSTGTFARITYAYDNQYLLEGSLRYDIFSLFPQNNKGAFFPSVSAGWIASNNKILSGSFLNYLKVKASWGKNGSRANLRTREDLQFYNGSGIGVPGDDESVILPGVGIGVIPNQNLLWETSEQIDLGFELRTLNNKVNFSANYFNKDTKDLIVTGAITAPASAGAVKGLVNGGSVNNNGFEFELGYNNSKNDFTYGINLNLTTLNNKVTQAGTNSAAGFEGASSRSRIVTKFAYNQPLWYFYGFKTNGINPSTGEVNYVDIDKDGKINSNDLTNIGKSNPDMIFGGQLKLGYKNLDFNVNIQGTQGNDIYMQWFRDDRLGTNKPASFYEQAWKKAGDVATFPRPNNTGSASNDKNVDGNIFQSDLMVQDGSYLRIQQIQLGYTFPKTLLKNIHLSNLRIYTSIEDYFTFTKYIGLDPTVTSRRNNSQGIDRGAYPTPGKIMFGLSVNL